MLGISVLEAFGGLVDQTGHGHPGSSPQGTSHALTSSDCPGARAGSPLFSSSLPVYRWGHLLPSPHLSVSEGDE